MDPSAQFRMGTLRNLALIGGATLVAVAGAEVLARLVAPRTPFEAQYEAERRYLERESALPFFRLDRDTLRPARERSSARPFPARKPAGEKLWFVIGESVAQRIPAQELSAALGGLAVNSGMGAYGSSAVLATARQLLEHDPDGFVVLLGNNGVGPAAGTTLTALAPRLRLARLWLDARRPLRENDAQWENDLRRLVRLARRRGAVVVLCTLPVNLQAAPHGELPLDDDDFHAGWSAFESGRAEDAARAWSALARRRPDDAMVHYWLGRALQTLSRTRGADSQVRSQAAKSREHFERALAFDYPDRCKPARNAAIRRVAAEEGATLADLDVAFRHAQAGENAFLDAVHWRSSWQSFTVAVISAAAAGSARAQPAPPPRTLLTQEEAHDLLRHALAMAIQAGEQPHPALHERLVGELERVWRDRPSLAAGAIADNAAAGRLLSGSDWTRPFSSPSARGWSSALLHAGEARWRTGARRDGKRLMRAALKADPKSVLARRWLGRRAP